MRKIFAIGDIQGCSLELDQLICRLPKNSRIVCLGDLVNRGPDSLGTLRRIKSWQEQGFAESILGNHDLHLLARAGNIRGPKSLDTLEDILKAPDRQELIDWLRRRPLALFDGKNLLVHAGIVPQWDIQQTMELAREVEKALQKKNYLNFIKNMYGNTPVRWSNRLKGDERLRFITNALTRMRFCSSKGDLDFTSKEGIDAAPTNYYPWFAAPKRKTAHVPIFFGHWSTLGLVQKNNAFGLDTGCVWGRKLSAMSLDPDHQLVQINATSKK